MSRTSSTRTLSRQAETVTPDGEAMVSATRRLECLAARHTPSLRREGDPAELVVADPVLAAAILRLLGPGARFFEQLGPQGEVIRLSPPPAASSLELSAALAALEAAAAGVLGEGRLDAALI